MGASQCCPAPLQPADLTLQRFAAENCDEKERGDCCQDLYAELTAVVKLVICVVWSGLVVK